jgi:hypothetical protein
LKDDFSDSKSISYGCDRKSSRVPGVFGCGDVQRPVVKRAACAVGERNTAIAFGPNISSKTPAGAGSRREAPARSQKRADRWTAAPRTPILQRNTSTFRLPKID